ncbi:hypothetical protein [uncultured Photobacterium sp.]|uniref:hypothetical protein n=1 Tax=uncultured Photobacterium sp. TaxID=173973 RepID=UPI0026043B20|nr:hypothetical protein [uncultured Photobacterium sp.]
MINKKEIKQFFIALGKKYFFPDFTNTLTRYVVGIGGAVILTPTALELVVYNWLVATINLNSGVPFTFAELESTTADYTLGFALIALSLLHNIVNKYFIYKTGDLAAVETKELQDADKVQFEKFLTEIPSDGLSIELLKEHDFGGSYHSQSIEQLKSFVEYGANPEKEFLDPELEKKRKFLWKKCHAFFYKLAQNSYSLGAGPVYSCIPDPYREAGNRPKHVEKQINELNDMATECFQLHKEFVLLVRRKLKC